MVNLLQSHLERIEIVSNILFYGLQYHSSSSIGIQHKEQHNLMYCIIVHVPPASPVI